MIRSLLIILASCCLLSCTEDAESVIIPDFDPSGSLAGMTRLSEATMMAMEGVYAVTDGEQFLGDEIVLKYGGGGLSVFTGRDATYCFLESGAVDSTLTLAGYWRRLVNTETGVLQLTIAPEQGGGMLQRGQRPRQGQVVARGQFNTSSGQSGRDITLVWQRPVHEESTPFLILAHRAGGRNSDLLPASENSAELVRLAERFGANGVEIDVQLTSDGVPVIYHDEKLNLRLTQKSGLVGAISDYTIAQLETFVRLRNGERIPTLKRMLATILRQTDLRFVWLDSKPSVPLSLLREIQKSYADSARIFGRDLTIVIGLPDDDKVQELLRLTDYAEADVLCELSLDLVRQTQAEFWAPRWTLGTQNAAVQEMQGEGRKVLVWTLDDAKFIEAYLRDGNFNGMLTNYPSLVAYYYYRQ
ncbi:glycerophosphodiester phosphodiesterase [bacterium]|nr:glycerophosphodiester phosphodiesterase [bacterium]